LFIGQYKPPIQHASPKDKGTGAENWQYSVYNKWGFYGIVLRNVGLLSFMCLFMCCWFILENYPSKYRLVVGFCKFILVDKDCQSLDVMRDQEIWSMYCTPEIGAFSSSISIVPIIIIIIIITHCIWVRVVEKCPDIPVAVVLTLVQTKQTRINIHKRNNT
jgi:hypothetical protein